MHPVTFTSVTKEFNSAEGSVRAIGDLSFEIAANELVAIVGQTGCGKSTAFSLIMGLDRPTSGKVDVLGVDPYREFDVLRGRISVVFQEHRLLPWKTALENTALGLEYLGVPRKQRLSTASRWLERLGLAGREHAFPYQLSGGMRQRVSIARAFAVDPEVILCDESFSALDELTAEMLREEFVRLVKEHKKSGIFITHSLTEALEVGERVLVFRRPAEIVDEVIVDPGWGESERHYARQRLRASLS